jgi:hypothetical protein
VSVVGKLDLREATTRRAAHFVNCRFGAIAADSGCFEKQLRLDRCSIERFRANYARFEGELRLRNTSVRELGLHNASFEKACSLHGGEFGRVAFSSCNAAANVRLRRLRAGTVTLSGATIRGTLDARRLEARTIDLSGLRSGRLQGAALRAGLANLDNIEVKDQIELQRAVIKGEFTMSSVEVGGDVDLTGCEVVALEISGGRGTGRLILDEMRVARGLYMVNSRFGALEMVFANVTGGLTIQDCSLDAVFLRGAHVGGAVEFNRNTVVGTIVVEDHNDVKSSFGSPASFGGSKAGSQIIVRNSVFAQRLSFFGVSATHLIVEDCEVGNELSAMGAVLTIALRVVGTRMQELNARGISSLTAQFKQIEVRGELKLSYARFQTTAFEDVEAADMEAVDLRVDGTLPLTTTRIWRRLDLTRARLGVLTLANDFDDVPDGFVFPHEVEMRDCTYGSLRTNWRRMLISFDRRNAHDPTSYRALEQFARVVGRPDIADTVYVAGRRHATRMLPPGMKRASEAVLDWISGYGAQPVKLLRAAALAFLVMVLIALLYEDRGAKPAGPPAPSFSARLGASAAFAFDVIVRGDKSPWLATPAPSPANVAAPPSIEVEADVLLGLRLVVLALLGLWSAYITGLVRYVTPMRR